MILKLRSMFCFYQGNNNKKHKNKIDNHDKYYNHDITNKIK